MTQRGSIPDQRERGAVLVADCDCAAGECWEIRCTDCGRELEAYDDETASDYRVHWPDRDEALDDCSAEGFEWWEDEPGQPVLCGGCIDRRLSATSDESEDRTEDR